jgi:uncharacterized membrane protein SpoIIM required for sporulation/uncharacterized RDD family membrane protein YckC
VVLEYELAGLGSRGAAAIIDSILLSLLNVAVIIVAGFALGVSEIFGPTAAVWALVMFLILVFLVTWGYYVLFEALGGGRTPGKRRLGIRVVMDTGHPVTFGAAAVRNLLRIADMQPTPTYFLGWIFVFLHPQNKRLGDIVAGTVVVRDRPDDFGLGAMAVAAPAEDADESPDLGPPELSDDEFRLLDQFLGRMDALEPTRRLRLLYDLVGRFAPRFPRRDPNPGAFLTHLHETEQAKRRSRFGTRRGAGVSRTTVPAERFVARKRDGWEAFRRLAAAAEARGLRRLAGSDITAFAAQYREVAADLARARTYRVDPRVVAYLERVVSAGHNALYGARRVRRARMIPLLLRDFPAAVVQGRGYVLVAFLLFMLPAIAGYVVIRERPDVVHQVLPDGIIARAEEGAAQQAEGIGYAETPSMFLPLVATSIIANNVQVAIGAFALGVTGGIGTVFVLVFNGLFIGAIIGLFANYGLAGWILTFVAGHGVLELTAIFIAGGAGLVVARALIAPGDVTRRDALVVQGTVALRMFGTAAVILLLAGTIEGLLSASDAPAGYKFGVSAISGVLLVLYFWNGWKSREARGA